MTLVKICGLTRDHDVRRAARLGAWACGFVLSDSPRQVTPERAARLADEAGKALTVAVVTTEPADWIADALAQTGLRAVQLSAGADGAAVGAVREAAVRRGLRPLIIAAADTADAAAADFTLLDARTTQAYGGTGQTLDWAALAQSERTDGVGGADAPTLPARQRLVLAGGLTPANVAQAIATLRPLAVDVSSGVESAPGVKDPALLGAFLAAVATADASSPSPIASEALIHEH
jgi:phosphoribosylanthranilate isomerase